MNQSTSQTMNKGMAEQATTNQEGATTHGVSEATEDNLNAGSSRGYAEAVGSIGLSNSNAGSSEKMKPSTAMAERHSGSVSIGGTTSTGAN